MSDSKKETPEVLEIRRYSNRRYYDTSRSQHVTLEAIRELVRGGQDVRITDASTGADITSRTLTQIILEYDDRKIAALPAAMLHRLIRSSESLLVEFMEQYFENATSLFEDSQRGVEEKWRRMTGGSAAVAPAMMGGGQSAWGGACPPSPPEAEPEPEPEPVPEGKGEEPSSLGEEELRGVVDKLREQLESVQSDLQKLRKDGPEGA
jgi:polyhydroxyalkanoate synthesis repressor PhaR